MAGERTVEVPTSNLEGQLDLAVHARAAQDIPADIVELVRQRCNLTQDQVNDVAEAVKSGVRSAAEYLGVTPGVANTVESMALEFYRQKHIMYALGLYAFLVEMDDKRSTAWRGMAACHQANRFYPMAVFCYQRALLLDPADVISTVFLGECLFIDGWREEGIRCLERAVIMGAQKPAHALYVKRAQTILSSQAAATQGAGTEKKRRDVPFDVTESLNAPAPAEGAAERDFSGVDFEKMLQADDLDFVKHPQIRDLAKRLKQRLERREITYKDVAGFTDEQLQGGYAAACRLIDAGQPLTALEVIGWMIYFDIRNGSYYQVAGLAAQHAKLYCFADYMYALSLIYDKDNPVTMLYQGEVKVYSFERHAGVELMRRAVEILSHDPQQRHLVKRGKALIKQFEKKTSQPTK